MGRRKRPGRRRTDAEVAARRAVIFQWWSLDRWNTRDQAVLAARFDITRRQLHIDLKKAREDAQLDLTDTEAMRKKLVNTLRSLQRLCAAHLLCTECQGVGLVEDAPCEPCGATGARLECSPQWAMVIHRNVELIRKLTGIETPPEAVIHVQVQTASPVALLQQVQAGVQAIEATGIFTHPVED